MLCCRWWWSYRRIKCNTFGGFFVGWGRGRTLSVVVKQEIKSLPKTNQNPLTIGGEGRRLLSFFGKGPFLVGRIFYVGFREVASGGDLKMTPSNWWNKNPPENHQFLVWKPPWKNGICSILAGAGFSYNSSSWKIDGGKAVTTKNQKGSGYPWKSKNHEKSPVS